MNSNTKNLIPEKDIYQFRVTRVVDKILKKNETFREDLDRDDIIRKLTGEMQKFSLKSFLSIGEEDLVGRIGRMIALDMLSKLTNGFTPEQRKTFNEQVSVR